MTAFCARTFCACRALDAVGTPRTPYLPPLGRGRTRERRRQAAREQQIREHGPMRPVVLLLRRRGERTLDMRTPTPLWIQQVRERVPLLTLAEALGFEVAAGRIKPCPDCGHEDGAKVRRGRTGAWWLCPKCSHGQQRGNLDFVAHALAGASLGDLGDVDRAMIRAWFAAQGWCDDGDETSK